MSNSFNIPREIREVLAEQIQIEKDARERDIVEFIKQCEIGNEQDKVVNVVGIVQNQDNEFEAQVRKIRLKSLDGFKSIKNWMGSLICWNMITDAKNPATADIEDKENELSEAYVQKNALVEERKCFIDKIQHMSNHDKYLSHKDEYVKEEKMFNRQSLHSLVFGIILTLIFSAIDFSMVNTMFINANLPYATAAFMAIITALALDAPPYLLGLLSERKSDLMNYYELMGIASSKYSKQQLKSLRIPRILLTIVIVAFISIYVLVCLMSFAGGGDFNITFHALIDGKLGVLTDIEYRGSDLLQSFVPLVTSVCSYVVGLLLQPSKTELYSKILRMINEKHLEKSKEFERKIAEADVNIEKYKKRLENKKLEYWGIYKDDKPYPVDEGKYIIQITQAFKKINIGNYESLYESCCIMLLSNASSYIMDINEHLAKYSNNSKETRNMTISDAEQAILDEIWIENTEEINQKAITQSHLNLIRTNIAKFNRNSKP